MCRCGHDRGSHRPGSNDVLGGRRTECVRCSCQGFSLVPQHYLARLGSYMRREARGGLVAVQRAGPWRGPAPGLRAWDTGTAKEKRRT